MSALRCLWRLLSPEAKKKFSFLVVLTTLSGFVEIVGVSLIIPFIAAASNTSPYGAARNLKVGLQSFLFTFGVEPENVTLVMGMLFLAGIICANSFLCLFQYLSLTIVYGQKAELGFRVMETVSRRNLSWHDHRNSADLTKALLQDVAFLMEVINSVVQVASVLTRCAVVYTFFLLTQFKLAVATAVALGLSYVLTYRYVHKPLVAAGKQAHTADAVMTRAASEMLGGIREVRVTGTEPYFLTRFQAAAEKSVQPQIIRGMPGYITRAALETATVGSVIALLIHFNSKDGNLANGLPMLSAYALAGIRLMPAVQQALYHFVGIKFHLPSLYRVAELLEPIPASEREGQNPSPVQFESQITLTNLSFQYPNATAHISDITLNIPKLHRVAFVGETGAGKSTLVDVILGLRSPQAGTLAVDGVPVTQENVRAWRKLIGYVPQTIYLLDASIAQNVALGVPEADLDYAKVERVCRLASIHDFILTLPKGYHSEIGERGVRLSGGQRQRIGIARALYHDPELVIFDEATSALDAVTEGNVLEALEALKGVKTLIVIAHRLNTVWTFDRLFVLQAGRLVGQGTAQELLEHCPTFQELASSQLNMTAPDPVSV